MKYKKTFVIFGLAAAFFGWREWNYSQSPQGKLDRIAGSGREHFKLSEVIGNDWITVCFLPGNYGYPPVQGISGELEILSRRLEVVLGRTIVPWKDWGDVSGKYAEAPYISVLTESGRMETGLYSLPWQRVRGEKVIRCTKNHDVDIEIVRRQGKYGFLYRFEDEIEF